MSEQKTEAQLVEEEIARANARDAEMTAGENEFLAYERGRAEVAKWMAYADKLETALKLACGQTTDRLMRMHAEQGLRIVRPTSSPARSPVE